jgi:hypothetical protein
MRTQKLITVPACDFCEEGERNTNCYRRCDNCGKDACDKHQDAIVQFRHGVYFSGSDDGEYCVGCLEALRHEGDARLKAFQQIQDLRDEAERWNEDFRKRATTAEAAVASFPKPQPA